MVKTQRNFLIAAIVGLLILFFLPPVNGLTDTGVRFLAVFIPTVIIWLIEGGSGWSGLMATALIVFLGVYNGAETYKLLWGGALVALCIPFYMIANALEECGAVMWVVRWILSRKIVHGRPTLFTILFTLSLELISVMITPMVTVVIFFKVLKDLCESIGYDRDSEFYRAHGLIIGWIGQAVDGCLIWGRPFILSMVAMIVGLGFERFTVNDFFRLSILQGQDPSYRYARSSVLLRRRFLHTSGSDPAVPRRTSGSSSCIPCSCDPCSDLPHRRRRNQEACT